MYQCLQMVQVGSKHDASTEFNGIQEERNSATLQYFSYLRPPLYTLVFALYLPIFDIVPIYYRYLIPTHIIFVISISLMILASCCAELVRKCEFELNFYIAKLNNEALFRKPPVYTKLYILFLTPILLDLKQ